MEAGPERTSSFFSTLATFVPNVFLVSIAPDSVLYEEANRRLTLVVYTLDKERHKISKVDMIHHKADYKRLTSSYALYDTIVSHLFLYTLEWINKQEPSKAS